LAQHLILILMFGSLFTLPSPLLDLEAQPHQTAAIKVGLLYFVAIS
jgi:hypothetical protein